MKCKCTPPGFEYEFTDLDKELLEILERKHMGAVKELAVEQKLEENKGVKFDAGKAPLDLLPYEALAEVARVLGFGEIKYGTGNWAQGVEQRRLISAALRHIGQFNSGEDFDPESGINHIAHATCNLLFSLWMYKNRPDLDNRWSKKVLPRPDKA